MTYIENTSGNANIFTATAILLRMETWQERAKRRMREIGLSQDELATRLGVTPGAVSHYLTGRREPSMADTVRIAQTLDMNLTYLVLGDGEVLSHVRRFDDGTMSQAVELLHLLSELRPEDVRFRRMTWAMILVAAKAIAKHEQGSRTTVVTEILDEMGASNGAKRT